jgi:hypothetical protein
LHAVLLSCCPQADNAQDAADTEELTAAKEAVAEVEGIFS